MAILNFLSEKVQKYYEKKLHDASQKLLFHQNRKKQLETDLKTANDELKISIIDEIDKQNDLIDIWEKNIVKINEQIEKLQK